MLLPSFGYGNGVRTNVFINLTFLPLFLLLTGTSEKKLESLKEDTSDADEDVSVDLILNYSMDGKLVYAQIGDDEYKLTIKIPGLSGVFLRKKTVEIRLD